MDPHEPISETEVVNRTKGMENKVKKAYWIVAYRVVRDETVLKGYAALAGPAIQAGGGRALVRTSDAIEVFEAGLKQRTVVIEFESFEKAVATYKSDAYQTALEALGSAVERDFRIVEGVE